MAMAKIDRRLRGQSVGDFAILQRQHEFSMSKRSTSTLSVPSERELLDFKRCLSIGEDCSTSTLNLRLAVVGGDSSGKSALTVRFLTKRFIGEYDSHTDSHFQREMVVSNCPLALHVKDTTKSNWLRNPTLLINWASAIVVVYSITDRESFRLAGEILSVINRMKPLEPACTLLLGNKDDLEHLREVSRKEGRKLAIHYGVQYHEVSAAEGLDNVDFAFMKVLNEAALVERTRPITSCSSCEDDDKLLALSSCNSSPREVRRKRKRSVKERLNMMMHRGKVIA